MEKKLATIERISEVTKHPNADALDIVKVKGWNVVAKLGEFKVGDLCVYIQIDTIVPEKPEFEFLRNKKFRVCTIKLRGKISQGIVFPISILEKPITAYSRICFDCDVVGVDVTEDLGVIKYEKPIPTCLAGQVKGNFPTQLLRKTDEERIQNMPEAIELFKDKEVYVSKKHDGTSGTFIKPLAGDLMVCSRNLELLDDGKNVFWKMAHKYNLDRLSLGVAIQAEVVGPGIQKNHEGLADHELRIFNVKDIFHNRYLSYDEMVKFCEAFEIPKVDDYYVGPFKKEWESVDAMLEEADLAKYSNGKQAEGLVWRLRFDEFSDELGKELSIKTISNKFALKHGE